MKTLKIFGFLLYSILFFIIVLSFACGNSGGSSGDNNNGDTSKNTTNVSGIWHGTYYSSHDVLGAFDVNITQNGSSLSGTIDIPYINIHNASLKGTINGNNITFGDIEDKIKFVGTLNGNNSSSGTYTYALANDRGTWQAAKKIPVIQFTIPANNETDVSVDSEITAIFSDLMDTTTITSSAFYLNNGITGTFEFHPMTARFIPSRDLEYDTQYTATITTAVKNNDGNAMAMNYSWTFTTGAKP